MFSCSAFHMKPIKFYTSKYIQIRIVITSQLLYTKYNLNCISVTRLKPLERIVPYRFGTLCIFYYNNFSPLLVIINKDVIICLYRICSFPYSYLKLLLPRYTKSLYIKTFQNAVSGNDLLFIHISISWHCQCSLLWNL